MTTPDRLQKMVRVAPPPELDRCVRERMLSAVEAEVSTRHETGDGHMVRGGASTRVHPNAPVALPLAEQCVYAFGLLGYGAQVLGAMARLVWRAVLG